MERSPSLDAYRGIACGMILVYHLPPKASSPLGLGQAAMELFFVLSGFLISRSLAGFIEQGGLAGAVSFAEKRIRRLLPGMIGFVIGAVLLNTVFGSAPRGDILHASVAMLTGWYNFYQCYAAPTVIGFGGIWSLSLEEQFYVSSVVVIFVCRCLWRRPVAWLFAWASVLLVAGFFFRLVAYLNILKWRADFLTYLPPLRMWGFGCGVLVSALTFSKDRAIERVGVRVAKCLIFGAVITIMELIVSVKHYDVSTFLFQWTMIPGFGAVLVLFAPVSDAAILALGRRSKTWPGRRWAAITFCGTFVCLLGKASYSIYLWHCLVIAAFVQLGWGETPYGWPSMLLLSLIAGLLSWRFIEKRFYRFA